jgi:hypothetical protein
VRGVVNAAFNAPGIRQPIATWAVHWGSDPRILDSVFSTGEKPRPALNRVPCLRARAGTERFVAVAVDQ